MLLAIHVEIHPQLVETPHIWLNAKEIFERREKKRLYLSAKPHVNTFLI